MKKLTLWIVAIPLILFSPLVFAAEAPDDAQKGNIIDKAYRINVPFIENRGQLENSDVGFYAKTFGGIIFVEKNGTINYNLLFGNKKGVAIKEIFTKKRITVEGLEPSPTRVNYFKGKEKSKWKKNIPSYERISLGVIYKGIDLTLRAYGNNVEKIFTVLPEGNPEIIKIKLRGANELKVNEKWELKVITEHGSLKFTKPLAYQRTGEEKSSVEIAYVIYKDTTYGFKAGNYDKKRPLIIDPLLASTFIGGSDRDSAYSMALDASGSVYIAGATESSDYPTTPGAYDESLNGNLDVLVSKLDSSLSSLLASTLIGGVGVEHAYSTALDASGNVFVTGDTFSSEYPATSGAYDESYNGINDVFVSKFDSSLSSLLASTFIGGDIPANPDMQTPLEHARSMALDASGYVFVAGYTNAPDYPTTLGAYDESHSGGTNVFVSKLGSDLSSLLASTFIGGAVEYSYSLALDASGNVFITGNTFSPNFPITPGAYSEIFNGVMDCFITKIDSDLSSIVASTFIGGGAWDEPLSMVLDGIGNVYVTGVTFSSDYPAMSGAHGENFKGIRDVFVSKFFFD